MGYKNLVQYIRMLEESLLPFGATNHDTSWIYQKDITALHRSNLTMNWLKSQNIEVMKYTTECPDLNPIANVWGSLSVALVGGDITLTQLQSWNVVWRESGTSWAQSCALRKSKA